MSNEPSAPKRAVRLTLMLDADNIEDLYNSLIHIAGRVVRGELTRGVVGGVNSGYVYELIEDPNMSHDAYYAELRKYLAKNK